MPQNSTDYLGYLGYKESTDNYQIRPLHNALKLQ